MLRTLRDAVIALIVERSVNAFFPTALPYAWTAILAWLTLDILKWAGVRDRLVDAYLVGSKKKVALAYLIIFLVGGLFLCVYFYGSNKLFALAIAPKLNAASADSQRIENLVEEVKQLRSDITKSPSVDLSVRLPILQEEQKRLSEKSAQFSRQEREILAEQGLTLQSLKKGREQYLERIEVEKQEDEIAQRRKTLEKEDAAKKAQEAAALRDQEFSNKYAPIVEYTITTFYRLLGEIAKQYSETIISDFPNKPPSLYRSALLVDGKKMVDGEHVMRLGDNAGWEFHLALASTNPRRVFEKCLNFSIRSGDAIMRVSTSPPIIASASPSSVNVNFNAMRRDAAGQIRPAQYNVQCSLTDYQKAIDQGLIELIQNRYNEHPLDSKP